MRIHNPAAWLPKPYYVATLNEQTIGYFSTMDEAQSAYEVAKAKADGVRAYVLPCGSLLMGTQEDCANYADASGYLEADEALCDPREILESCDRVGSLEVSGSVTVSGANESRRYAYPVAAGSDRGPCWLYSLDN